MRRFPLGRGFYVWHLYDCCGGNIDALIAHCHDHAIGWLAIKWLANKVGGKWVQQFTPDVVARLKAAGIGVYGWHYDLPGQADAQADIVKAVCDADADGFISDSEIEWDKDATPDAHARAYGAAIAARGLRPDFLIAHAPFDVIAGHQNFPYTALGEFCDFVAPQMYWPEHGVSEVKSTARALIQWTSYRTKHPDACKELVPSGYSVQPDLAGGRMPTAADLVHFEQTCADAGCPAVLHWRFDGTPDSFWAGLKGTGYPAPASLDTFVCPADPDAAAPGC